MKKNIKCSTKFIVIDEPVKKFLDSLKFLRKSAGMRLKDLADEVGTTLGTVYDWESGRCYPRLNKLIRLAEIFNYDISESLNYKYFYKTIQPANIQSTMRHYGLNYLELEQLTGYNRARIRASILMKDYGTIPCLAAVLDVIKQERRLAEFRRRQL